MSTLDIWEPATVAEVAALFAVSPAPWWIAGGHAIELATGFHREHVDMDVLLLRRDQHTAQQALGDWQWYAADPPGTLRPWLPDKHLPLGVHDIWCRPYPDSPWRVQIMLDESDGDEWVSRRHPAIRRPIADIGALTTDGVPYLAPEIQLYYKAKQPRPKDQADFDAALPLLSPTAREWLDRAIHTAYGDHPWRAHLRAEARPRQQRHRRP